MRHVALVTGGASGIGAAIARELVAAGNAVVVADINAAAGEAFCGELRQAGHEAVFARLDVADAAGWAEACASAERGPGPVDILVNNAGMFRDRTLSKLTMEDWDRVLEVNLKGAWLGIRQVWAGMKQGGWGRILNVSSSAHRGSFGQANYSAAKGGLVSLTRTAAMEGVRYGILVNAVAPHNVDTQTLQSVPQEIRDGWMAKARLGRFLRPDEVAYVAGFFLSERNTAVTGQLLEVDGGDLVGVS